MSITITEGEPLVVEPGWTNVEPGDPAAGPVAPVLASLTPTTAQIGDPDFTLHVTGTGFTAASVIVFNGFDEPTTLVSDTEITTGVNMSVWLAPTAPLPVVVRTDGAVSNALSFTFTEAAQ
jgi:IPT/TIG domain